MTFKIVVCLKQVPDTNDIKWTENNTIQREGLDSIINPYDIGALYFAKEFKRTISERNIDVEITAVTMGPNQSEDILRKAISFGCDRAYLLCDKKFSGSDTLATAYTLSQFIKSYVPDFKLILCGQQAIDGDTAQTPSSMAEKLSIAQITNVVELFEANEVYSVWEKDTGVKKETIKSGYPLLVAAAITPELLSPRINDYIKSQNAIIPVLNAQDINANLSCIGFSGSPTMVKKAFRHSSDRNVTMYENLHPTEAVSLIIDEINKCRNKNDI